MGVGEISAMMGLIRRNCLKFEMKDDLAQLFFEAEYADQQEEGRHINTLCALTDGMPWHFFLVYMRALQFVNYVKAIVPKIVCNDTMSTHVHRCGCLGILPTPERVHVIDGELEEVLL